MCKSLPYVTRHRKNSAFELTGDMICLGAKNKCLHCPSSYYVPSMVFDECYSFDPCSKVMMWTLAFSFTTGERMTHRWADQLAQGHPTHQWLTQYSFPGNLTPGHIHLTMHSHTHRPQMTTHRENVFYPVSDLGKQMTTGG